MLFYIYSVSCQLPIRRLEGEKIMKNQIIFLKSNPTSVEVMESGWYFLKDVILSHCFYMFLLFIVFYMFCSINVPSPVKTRGENTGALRTS